MNFEGKTAEFITPQQVLGNIDDSLLGGDPEESVNVLLINEVKKYPILYDFNNEKYSDKEIRARIWARISEDLGISIKEAKHHWKRLRDSLRDALKRQDGKLTISGAICRKTWRYHKKMEFVIPFMTARDPAAASGTKRSRRRRNANPNSHPPQDAALTMLASALNVSGEGAAYYNGSTNTSAASSSSSSRIYKGEGVEMSLLEELAHKPLDEDLYFCLSMAASMKRLSEQRRARLKCDMMSMLYTAQCEEAFP
ncbi:transcription factor Adf-1-like isoform X2 [Frankliniella occidentalis]|uniref:Transcription factor Adf-1-like isoform X2 n=1 Tax=Frankliniella occidentalis TaxID=133901 RepID=A0A6J1RZ93_FRAOC|nr:transcription factor Adf-1-like isoform X2 [Frankliniella occidentalis]